MRRRVKKRCNKKFNRTRVVVEHAIGRMKKFKIMGSIFRNRLKTIVSGLTNFRAMISSGFDLNGFVA